MRRALSTWFFFFTLWMVAAVAFADAPMQSAMHLAPAPEPFPPWLLAVGGLAGGVLLTLIANVLRKRGADMLADKDPKNDDAGRALAALGDLLDAVHHLPIYPSVAGGPPVAGGAGTMGATGVHLRAQDALNELRDAHGLDPLTWPTGSGAPVVRPRP